MSYLVSVDHNGMAVDLTRSECGGLYEVLCIHCSVWHWLYVVEWGCWECEEDEANSYIQGVSQLVDITTGGDFLGLCDQKSSYKHVSDFGRLQSYDRLKLGIEGNNYWQ